MSKAAFVPWYKNVETVCAQIEKGEIAIMGPGLPYILDGVFSTLFDN